MHGGALPQKLNLYISTINTVLIGSKIKGEHSIIGTNATGNPRFRGMMPDARCDDVKALYAKSETSLAN